jgi:hypothetical protein
MNPFSASQSEKELKDDAHFADLLSQTWDPTKEVSARNAEKALVLVEEQFAVAYKQTISVASILDHIKRHIHKHVAPEKQNDFLMLVDASITRVGEACNTQQKMKQTLKHVSTYVDSEVSKAVTEQERKRRRVEPGGAGGVPQAKTDAPATDEFKDMKEALEHDKYYFDSEDECDPDAEVDPDNYSPPRMGSD